MNIQGLQKLTLLDYPGHTACTVFTGGCNLRCPFCHNAPLVLDPNGNPPFSEEEIFALLEKRKGILDGVAVTGGEPLLHKDIGAFLKKVKDRGFAVKLDTNGFFPDRLEALLKDGLVDYAAMDVKNRPEKYAATCGLQTVDLAAVEKSMSLLTQSGIEYEFRTTVVKEFHTIDDIEAAAKWISGAKRYFLQAFRDSGELLSGGCSGCAPEEMHEMADRARRYVELCEVRGVE
ncbi:MAG: anaerobic ribonucleoside-triphosphate reductase activating protein [Clostridia bacterium]|nr:anaerobic ribonucleoside-triphosphate reductase activating protein [Clostridia bacterium]